MVDPIASSHDRSHQTDRTYLGTLRLEGYHRSFNILLFHVAGRQYALKKPPSSNDEPSDNQSENTREADGQHYHGQIRSYAGCFKGYHACSSQDRHTNDGGCQRWRNCPLSLRSRMHRSRKTFAKRSPHIKHGQDNKKDWTDPSYIVAEPRVDYRIANADESRCDR